MNPRLRTPLIISAVVIVLGGALFFVRHEARAQSATSAAPRAVMAVKVARATQRNWPLTVTASGAIASWQDGIISAETGGLRLTALHADVGDHVKRGQLLAELAQDSVNADLRKYEAALASARASFAQAHANAERARAVKSSGALSEQQINDYLIAEQTTQANVDSAQAQLDAQRVTLSHTRVVAVDDGVITSRSATLGKVVSSGEELFRLVRQNRYEWKAEVDARQLPHIRSGQNAHLTLPDGSTIQGKVRVAAPTLSADTSRAYIYVSLPVGSAARSGMYATGQIELGMQMAWTVPQSVVVLRDGMSYVFEIGSDNHIIRHKVVTGRRVGNEIEIVSGLQPDAKLVASGGSFLSDGDLVSINSGKEKP